MPPSPSQLRFMDTFPWLESAFLDYKKRHFIPKNRCYSSLCEESNGILKLVCVLWFSITFNLGLIDFVSPTGFSFRFDSSPSTVLFKSISLRLPSRAFGIGFIHQSLPASTSNSHSRGFFFGPYFMYGKVSANDGGTIEAYYSQKISTRGHFSLSSLFDNYCEPSNHRSASSSQSRTHFQWDFGRFALASSYCTFGKIFGLQFLMNSLESISSSDSNEGNSFVSYENKINFGGEVYYTAQEGSGGVSLGLRLIRTAKLKESNENQLIFTLTGNPLMGHYRTTLTTPFISPNVSVSTRFDINLNSFDSDLALGIAYKDPSPLNQGIRFALGLKNGCSFVIQTNVTENIKIRFGLKTGPFFLKLGDNNILNRSTGSFGLDLAICN